MSTDVDVYCTECKAHHGFHDADHEWDLIRFLAKQGPKLKQIALLWLEIEKEAPCISWEPAFYMSYQHHRLNFKWWAEHGDHKLLRIDEYGRLDGECGDHFSCPTCKSHHCCQLPDKHDGDHFWLKERP